MHRTRKIPHATANTVEIATIDTVDITGIRTEFQKDQHGA